MWLRPSTHMLVTPRQIGRPRRPASRRPPRGGPSGLVAEHFWTTPILRQWSRDIVGCVLEARAAHEPLVDRSCACPRRGRALRWRRPHFHVSVDHMNSATGGVTARGILSSCRPCHREWAYDARLRCSIQAFATSAGPQHLKRLAHSYFNSQGWPNSAVSIPRGGYRGPATRHLGPEAPDITTGVRRVIIVDEHLRHLVDIS